MKNQIMKMKPYFQIPLLSILALVLLVGTGCDKEKMEEMVAKAKDATGDAINKVKESTSEAVTQAQDVASQATTSAGNLVSMNGTAKIKLDSQTDFPASFIRIVPLGDGTSVVQMKSYKDGDENSYPSFFMQGVVDQSSVDGLNGKSVPCKFFAQVAAEREVWANAEGQAVVVEFKKVDKSITATFSGASLVNTANGSQTTSSGILDCVKLN